MKVLARRRPAKKKSSHESSAECTKIARFSAVAAAISTAPRKIANFPAIKNR